MHAAAPAWWQFASISEVFSQQPVTSPLSSWASLFKLQRTEATYNASVVTSGTPSNNSICRCFASLFWLRGVSLLSIGQKSEAERRRELWRSRWRLEEKERWWRRAFRRPAEGATRRVSPFSVRQSQVFDGTSAESHNTDTAELRWKTLRLPHCFSCTLST